MKQYPGGESSFKHAQTADYYGTQFDESDKLEVDAVIDPFHI